MTQPARNLSPEEAIQLAQQSQREGNLEDARKIYERVLSILPGHPQALTFLGSIAYQKGDDIQADAYLDHAIQVYRLMLDQQPDSVSVRAGIVNQLLARDRTAEALSFLPDLKLQMNPARVDPGTFQQQRRAAIARGRGPMLINTMPKSASETIWNRLAAGLGMAQSHVSMGIFPDCYIVPYRMETFAEGGVIAKEHIPAAPHNLAQLRRFGVDRVVMHVRDPRQATLSWAHFVRDDVSMRLMGPIWRKIVPPASVLRQDLNAAIDWSIDVYLPQLIDFLEAWWDIGESRDHGIEVRFLSFEYFRRDPDAYIRQVLETFGVPADSFDWQASAEDVHYRKGELDEWRGVFTRQQARRAWDAIPRRLADCFSWTP